MANKHRIKCSTSSVTEENTNMPTRIATIKKKKIQKPNRLWDFSSGSDGKESACNARDLGWICGSGRSWRWQWLPTPVFLPREFHGPRRHGDCSPWGCIELDTLEPLTPTHNEALEKLEPSNIAGGNVKCFSCYGKQWFPRKLNMELPCCSVAKLYMTL